MILDFDGTKAVFYDQVNFTKDSLRQYAFDRSGKINDDVSYAQITDLAGDGFLYHWTIFHDYVQGHVTHWYRYINLNVKGDGTVPVPQWELLKEEQIVLGYNCKRARSRFMGRDWYVWYTEDIPASAGPWLLRGLPGLIIAAIDSNKYFYFKMRYIEEINESRYDYYSPLLEKISKNGSNRLYSHSLQDADRMVANLWQNVTLYDNLTGAHTADGYFIDKNGIRHNTPKNRPYIPIIPEKYWKEDVSGR